MREKETGGSRKLGQEQTEGKREESKAQEERGRMNKWRRGELKKKKEPSSKSRRKRCWPPSSEEMIFINYIYGSDKIVENLECVKAGGEKLGDNQVRVFRH